MQAINNSSILLYNINRRIAESGAVGAATYSYSSEDNTITVTDASTIASPDSFGIMHVDVYDRFGNKVYGKIESAEGNVAIDVSDLNASEGFAVSITLVTANKITKDGTAFFTGNAEISGDFNVEQ
jgi:hypothetical protein